MKLSVGPGLGNQWKIGDEMLKQILFTILLISNYANAEYFELKQDDIDKYHICSSTAFSDLIDIGCDKSLIQYSVFANDDRLLDKYITFQKGENLYIISPYENVEVVLNIIQEIPLKYTISTFNKNFSGTFYQNDENGISRKWLVKCNKIKISCLISSDILSLQINEDSTITTINNTANSNFKSLNGIDQVLDFSKWAISEMKK